MMENQLPMKRDYATFAYKLFESIELDSNGYERRKPEVQTG
jgi:hypothetical protein